MCTVGRLRHSVIFALIRMVQIGRIRIQEENRYVYVFIRIPRLFQPSVWVSKVTEWRRRPRRDGVW